MRVLVDIVHPADVLFYKNLLAELNQGGHATTILARDRDVTHSLLDGFELEYETAGAGGRKGRIRLGAELISRTARLVAIGRRTRPDIVLTRTASGVVAARILGVPGVFDTDDGRAVGIYWRAAVPFATVLTMPESLTDDYRNKRIAYAGHKALAHLHPNRFVPDPSVRRDLGLGPDDRYFLVRFVAMTPHTDRHESGISDAQRSDIIERLSAYGRVFISSEAPLTRDLEQFQFTIAPHRMPDALAFASAMVGDSQSMATEAALLGVPAVRLSTWAGRLPGLQAIEKEFGLVFEYTPAQADEFLDRLDDVATTELHVWRERRERLLEGKVDLTSWYRNLVFDLVASGRGRRRRARRRRRTP